MDSINNKSYSIRSSEYKKMVDQLKIDRLISIMLSEYNKKQGKTLKLDLTKKGGK